MMLYNLVNYACQSVVSFTFLMGGGFVSAKYLKLKEDINEIYKAAIRSKLAYSTKEEIISKWQNIRECTESCIDDSILQGIETEPVFINNDNTGAQGYILYDKANSTVYLTFRGTNDLKDIKYDLENKLENVLDTPPTLKVHTGFLSQMMSLRSSINQTLANLDFNTLVLSGHSLGGALATIASMHYSAVYPDKKIKLIVFGSPRCGNKAFTDLVNQIVPDHIRVVNSTDPINEYPLCKVYQHISNCLTIKYNGTARLSNNDVNWIQRLFATILYFSLADHFLFNYIDNLKKMI